MARRLRIEFPGAIYHVMNRGIDRRSLFRSEQDAVRFEESLAECVDIYQVRIHAYALLPNHFHLLVETPGANLGVFMQALQTRYGVYFNKKHRKSGHVYQGPYKAILVEADQHLLKLSRYIHLNPVQTKEYEEKPIQEIIKALREYGRSSYRGYVHLEKRKEWVSYELLEGQVNAWFGERRGSYRKYVETGLAEDDMDIALAIGRGGLALGTAEFVENIKERYRGRKDAGARKAEDISDRRTGRQTTAEEILNAVVSGLGIEERDMMLRRGGAMYRGVAARMLLKYGGMTQRKAAEILHVSTGAAISVRLKELDRELKNNRSLARKVSMVEKRLKGQ
ncbi:MAG: transposase [Verrucomicrobia bacterium]|nr:transposase [Verrucomicrobiota bacterium]